MEFWYVIGLGLAAAILYGIVTVASGHGRSDRLRIEKEELELLNKQAILERERREAETRKLNRERLLIEAKTTILVITARDDRGEVDIRWHFNKAPPDGTNPTIYIFKSRKEALGDYDHAKQNGTLIVNTTEAGQYQDSETKKTGGDFYYTGFVFIDGIDNPVTHAVTHIKIDSRLYRHMERLEVETKVAKAEAKMHATKYENVTNQTGYIKSEAKLQELEEETGIFARHPKERDKQARWRQQNIKRMEAQKSKHQAIGVAMKEITNKIKESSKTTQQATDQFKKHVLEVKIETPDETLRFENYDALLTEMANLPELARVNLRSLVEEIDPDYKEAGEMDYESLEDQT